MASANVKAAYNQRSNAGQSTHELRKNGRLKKLEAHATVPRDHRAPGVVKKADEDLRQQEQEMGDDVSNDAGSAGAAGSPQDSDASSGPRSDAADAQADGPAGEPSAPGPDAEPLSPDNSLPAGEVVERRPGESKKSFAARLKAALMGKDNG